MTRRDWTPDEDVRLLAGRAKRKSGAWIAADLGRPVSSIYSRLNTLKKPPRANRREPVAPAPARFTGRLDIKRGGPGERRPRKCLCCGADFLSAHAGNRLCTRCRSLSASPYAP